MSTFHFVNQSCYRRQEEIAMVRRFFFINGFAEDTDLATTDIVILFTCAFCQSRVADMLGEIEHIRSVIKVECELIVGSCLPETDKAGLERVFRGRTISPTNFYALNGLPGIMVKIEEVPTIPGGTASCAMTSLVPPRPGGTPDPMGERGMGVFIASGCRRKCSYCAIRFATGQLRSKPLEVVTRMFSTGLESGYRKFEVHADSIGDYGFDIGTDLGALFDWMLQENREFSIGIYDLHPQAFMKFHGKLYSLCEAGRVHYLYVPLQSGNARILSLMNRPCDPSDLLKRLQEFHKHDGLFLQTSIIVGFPTETNQEFEETLNILQAVGFSDVYVHFYSDMPNTESAMMSGKIDKATMWRRLSRLADTGINYNREKVRHEWENIPI